MKNRFFNNIKGNFGFGLMRLPMTDKKVNIPEACRLVDEFINAGFNYFDTARIYLNDNCERAFRECVAMRYPRESYVLTNKLSASYFETEAEIRPLFEQQLNDCGVEYFDFYLMHSQNSEYFEKYKKCRAYETAFALKKEGKIRHVGISFHDGADVLDKILTEYPDIEVVQLQINYIDFDDAAIQGRECYEVCVRHGKPVIAMEPVKGGSLVNIPEAAKAIFEKTGSGSAASYALRFAADFDNMMMVISGMSTLPQVKDNISTMSHFKPLTTEEREAIGKVCKIIRDQNAVPCTGCRYCESQCPKNIPISEVFSALNAKRIYNNWSSSMYYSIHTSGKGKASDCIKCGKCEKICPQKLVIPRLMEEVANTFDK